MNHIYPAFHTGPALHTGSCLQNYNSQNHSFILKNAILAGLTALILSGCSNQRLPSDQTKPSHPSSTTEPTPTVNSDKSFHYQWVQIGDSGVVSVRVATSAAKCPKINIDGDSQSMSRRLDQASTRPPGFENVLVCQTDLPAQTHQASIGNKALPLPAYQQDQQIRSPQKLAIIGDTGCRVAGSDIQNCTGAPELGPAWEFAAIAQAVAQEQSELVIHVGDYHYREEGECDARCDQRNIGYTWRSWHEDFFKPAQSLLEQAPWVMIRGNHEDCSRSWKGWFYFFAEGDLAVPNQWNESSCEHYSEPFTVPLGQQQLVVMDTSAIPSVYSQVNSQQVRHFKTQFEQIFAATAHKTAWLAAHHPLWGISSFNDKSPDISTLEETLQAALAQTTAQQLPTNFKLLLAGHVHLFEALEFTDTRPPQFVFGGGGTKLSPEISDELIRKHPDVLQSLQIESQDFSTFHAFDYGIVEPNPTGWKVTVKSLDTQANLPGPYQVKK